MNIHIKLEQGLQNKMGNRFLVIRWSGMGDVVMTLPAVKWLSEHVPDCTIWYLTDRAFTKIPELSGVVHHVETIPRSDFKSIRRLPAALWQTIRTILRLRRVGFDRVFDLQGFGETAIVAFLTGAPDRIGRIKGSSLRGRIYTIPIRGDWEHDHRCRYFVQAVSEASGCEPPQTIDPPRFPKNSGSRIGPGRLVGLNIGASTASRRWSEESFFQLARRLSAKGYAVRFFLGPQEESLKETAIHRCAAGNWQVAVHTRIEDLVQALSECRLVISNDTGPGHVAAAMGIPVITLFSTGSPENVRPLAPKAGWFRNEADINLIPVSAVESASLEMLASLER